MKQEISQNESNFVRKGFAINLRSDGRANTDSITYKVVLNTVEEAFGSATVTFGEQDT